jgi:hypothetical protein
MKREFKKVGWAGFEPANGLDRTNLPLVCFNTRTPAIAGYSFSNNVSVTPRVARFAGRVPFLADGANPTTSTADANILNNNADRYSRPGKMSGNGITHISSSGLKNENLKLTNK